MKNNNRSKTTETPTPIMTEEEFKLYWDTTAKEPTNVRLPTELRLRLGRYILEQHGGRQNLSSRFVAEGLDRLLKERGY